MTRSLPFLYAAEELADALADRLTPVLAKAQLTTTQLSVLYLLIEEGPMRLGELAAHQRCVKSNVSYLTRAMQREGLIELVSSEEDARARLISASKLGKRRYAVARAGVEKLETALRRALGAKAVTVLEQACLKAAAALDGL